MPAQFWQSHIAGPPPAGPGSAYNTSVTLTDVSPTPNVTVPAKFLNYVGATIRLTAYGTFSNTSTPTLLLGFYYGGVAGVSLGNSGAITTTTGATNWPWRMEMTGVVRTLGSSGTIMCQGVAWFPTSLNALSAIPIPNTALATVTIDTTAAKDLTVGAQWGTSSASNTLTCHQIIAESVV